MSTGANSSAEVNKMSRTIDVGAFWNTIRQEVNIIPENAYDKKITEEQNNHTTTKKNCIVNASSTPTMVFSVIGDSDSFVPRPWPKTVFQTALIEAAKSGGETWILFRKNKEVVSNVIQEAYGHYEDMEFGEDKDEKSIGDPQRHIKLINIAPQKPLDDTSEDFNTETWPCEYTKAIYEKIIGEDEDQLLEFEKHISKQEVSFFNPEMNIKMPVPIAIIVCEGDLRTIVHVAKALKENIPVIIMKGSGKAADLVLDYIDKNDEFRKKASNSFGIQFDNDKYRLLRKYLGKIIRHKDIIGVFDLNEDDPLKLSNIVGETVVSCWSMKHVIPTQDNVQENYETKDGSSGKSSTHVHDDDPTLKGFSLTWKFLQKNSVRPEERIFEGFNMESRAHILNPKFSTPTSLPLYFYFVYQLLQESRKLEKFGPTLLLEALKANRCDYVRVLLAKGVNFRRSDLPELYRQTVACNGCGEDPPCLHIEWILKQLAENHTKTMCQLSNDLSTTGNIEEGNSSQDFKVADAAEALCRTILRYEKCIRCGMAENYNCCLLKSEQKRSPPRKDKTTISDILLWAIFANRKELAEICWLRSENHLLTGLVCSAILKKLSKKANNVKEHVLSNDLEEHSKLFEQRCIALMNSMYKENTTHAIDLMDDEAYVWGIHSSPLAFAHENFMYDIVAHTCSQKNMNKHWYNNLPPDIGPFVNSMFTKPRQFLTAPLTKYVINYFLFFIMLIMYSAFVLTSISTKYYVHDIAKVFEYYVYFWGAGDLMEEIISCFGCMENQSRSDRNYYRRMKRYFNDFWNVVDLLSYVLLIAAFAVRHMHPSQTFTVARRMFSLSLLVMYLRFLEVFLIHRKMGPTLIMIKEMLKDLLRFLSIAVFVVLGVGIYYHANLWPDHQTMWSGDWTNWRIWTIIYYPYWQLYGELNLDYLDGSKPDYDEGECTNITTEWESDTSQQRCPQEDWTVQAVSAAYMLFTNLLLVNLVIAMFSYTFERVQENSEKLWRFERYTVINDYDWRIPSPFNLVLLPVRVACYIRKRKCCLPCCKLNCCCNWKNNEKDKKKVEFRKNFQKIIALRNHNKI
nr:transient receptor potential cation channel subfamily M member 2-like [Crassostrea gigas]